MQMRLPKYPVKHRAEIHHGKSERGNSAARRSAPGEARPAVFFLITAHRYRSSFSIRCCGKNSYGSSRRREGRCICFRSPA